MRSIQFSRRLFLKTGVAVAAVSLAKPLMSLAADAPAMPKNAAIAAGSVAATNINKPDIVVIPTKVYPAPDAPDGLFPVTYRKLLPIDAPRARYPGFAPGKFLLKAGTVRREGAKPLPVDIIFERDVAMQLRDGTTIYTDIFRPANSDSVPAIFSWSPYGKAMGGQWLDDLPNRSGVPLALVSELQRFEGADPAYWCANGYAVVNPDPRGALRSEGNVTYWGRQLAEDGYDFIEWLAMQAWCSGDVVMSGNSWLAVSQWFIAAERPPHLRAIAPWEGLVEGGPAPGVPAGVVFGEIIIQSLAGQGYIEDQPRMLLQNPLMNAYWQDRKARLERIEVPAYIVASYTNMAHTVGTFEGYNKIASKDKWLRIHNTQEWTDYYQPEHVEDLRRFFDHYTKAAKNGWQSTPKVRMAVLDPGGEDTINRAESSFPPARAQEKKLYLQAKNLSLSPQPSQEYQALKYDAEDGKLRFTLRFTQTTEVCGYMSLRLWVEAIGADDMEIAVNVRKKPSLLESLKELIPSPIATFARGLLRVSMRELDSAQSTPNKPVLAMRKEQRLAPKEIVPIDIALSPMAMRFHAGETLELTIQAFNYPKRIPFNFGEYLVPYPEDGLTFDPKQKVNMRMLGGKAEPSASKLSTTPPPSRNHGEHVIHLGKEYESYLRVSQI